MRPSVSRLIAYVSAIGVPLAAVFDTGIEKAPEARPRAGRGGPQVASQASTSSRSARSWEVAPIRLSGGVTFRRLSPVPTPGVEFFESTYPPNSISNAHGQLPQARGLRGRVR